MTTLLPSSTTIGAVALATPDLARLVDFYRGEVAMKAKSGVEALVKRGIKLGQFRKVDPHAAARALIGGILFEALWAHVLRGPTKISTPAWLDSHIDLVLNGLEKR